MLPPQTNNLCTTVPPSNLLAAKAAEKITIFGKNCQNFAFFWQLSRKFSSFFFYSPPRPPMVRLWLEAIPTKNYFSFPIGALDIAALVKRQSSYPENCQNAAKVCARKSEGGFASFAGCVAVGTQPKEPERTLSTTRPGNWARSCPHPFPRFTHPRNRLTPRPRARSPPTRSWTAERGRSQMCTRPLSVKRRPTRGKVLARVACGRHGSPVAGKKFRRSRTGEPSFPIVLLISTRLRHCAFFFLSAAQIKRKRERKALLLFLLLLFFWGGGIFQVLPYSFLGCEKA